MRNEFIYSCRKKKNPCLRIRWTLRKHSVHHSAGCGSIFPAQSCQDAWRSGSWLSRSQHNMTDNAKRHSSIHSTFEQLLVWCAVRHCHGEKLGLFCWPMLVVGIAIISASHGFAEHISYMWCFHRDLESCGASDRQQTTKQWPWPFFGASLALGSALELLLSPATELVINDCHIKFSFIPYHNQIKEWFIVVA